jgi:hypothetical protein
MKAETMLIVNSHVYDIEGGVHLQFSLAESAAVDTSRRATKTLTLDGGVYVDDRGYVAEDQSPTFNVTDYTEEQYKKLRELHEQQSSVIVSVLDGAYSATLFRVARGAESLALVFYYREKLSV